MRRPISWSELADASVGVWGLGVEGHASVRRLRAMGVVPKLVDEAPGASEFDGLEVSALNAGGLDALTRCDVVIKSPGISRYRPEVTRLERDGVAVCGGLGLFMQEADRSKVACITGTKGKSTTTALTGRMLEAAGFKVAVGGNIGSPLSAQVSSSTPDTLHVVETSSFQLEQIETFHPWIAVMLNFSPDHLDRHPTVGAYGAAKARVFENQEAGDWKVINADDPAVLELARKGRAQTRLFARRVPIDQGSTIEDGWIVDRRVDGPVRDVRLVPLNAIHLL